MWNLEYVMLYFSALTRPTTEFPHPLSRVKQQAGYRVSLYALPSASLIICVYGYNNPVVISLQCSMIGYNIFSYNFSVVVSNCGLFDLAWNSGHD